jgi:hypothetical protein
MFLLTFLFIGQFGWLQAPATKISLLSATSANPATIRICSFCPEYPRRG